MYARAHHERTSYHHEEEKKIPLTGRNYGKIEAAKVKATRKKEEKGL